MAEQIKDGTGRGYLVEVGSDNHMHVDAFTHTHGHYLNHEYGEAYNAYATATPTAAGDVFMYIKNTGTEDMVIDRYRAYAASAEAIDIYLNEVGTPASGTAFVPVNANAGSANAAPGTFQYGNDITGLSGGTLLDRARLEAGKDVIDTLANGIILPTNAVLTLHAVTGAIAIEWTWAFHRSVT